jgi:hypothetical protein
MATINKVLACLNSDETMYTAAFFTGFTKIFKLNTSTFENIFRSLIDGSIHGSAAILCAWIVTIFMPEKYKFIISSAFIATILHNVRKNHNAK